MEKTRKSQLRKMENTMSYESKNSSSEISSNSIYKMKMEKIEKNTKLKKISKIVREIVKHAEITFENKHESKSPLEKKGAVDYLKVRYFKPFFYLKLKFRYLGTNEKTGR